MYSNWSAPPYHIYKHLIITFYMLFKCVLRLYIRKISCLLGTVTSLGELVSFVLSTRNCKISSNLMWDEYFQSVTVSFLSRIPWFSIWGIRDLNCFRFSKAGDLSSSHVRKYGQKPRQVKRLTRHSLITITLCTLAHFSRDLDVYWLSKAGQLPHLPTGVTR